MSVLYYQYYLFYKDIWKDSDANFTTRLSLTLLESLLISGICQILFASFFCKKFPLFAELGLTLVLLLINIYIVFNARNERRIMASKPKIFNSRFLSNLFAVIFFLVSASAVFWVPDYTDATIGNCCYKKP